MTEIQMGINRERILLPAARMVLPDTVLFASTLLCGRGYAEETARITWEDPVSLPALGTQFSRPGENHSPSFAMVKSH